MFYMCERSLCYIWFFPPITFHLFALWAVELKNILVEIYVCKKILKCFFCLSGALVSLQSLMHKVWYYLERNSTQDKNFWSEFGNFRIKFGNYFHAVAVKSPFIIIQIYKMCHIRMIWMFRHTLHMSPKWLESLMGRKTPLIHASILPYSLNEDLLSRCVTHLSKLF